MIKVLDHGFVRFVERWGYGDSILERKDTERGIIEAARQSTQGSFRGWDVDEKLLRYLYENKHATPFEFAGMVIEVRAPIFVFREWHRHRTQSYNEMSGRYAPLPALWYTPTVKRLMLNSKKNKQAGTIKGAEELTPENAQKWVDRHNENCRHFALWYEENLRLGIPKELARCGMPLCWYSQMRASTCLRNWLAFLTLRMASAAQWEIQQYANAVGEYIKAYFPKTWELFCEGQTK